MGLKIPQQITGDKDILENQINQLISDFEKKHDVVIFPEQVKEKPNRVKLWLSIDVSKCEVTPGVGVK